MNLVANAEQRRRREAQDMLALDIAKGDEDISITMRSVIERGYSDTFNESLQASMQKKTSEIERISARHYSDFLLSTKSMFEIRGAAGEIGGVVEEINNDFAQSGNKLVDVLTELEKYQEEREKTHVVLESVMRCKELSKLMHRSSESLKQKDFYSALRNIMKVRNAACASPRENPLPQPMLRILLKWYPATTAQAFEAVSAEAETLLAEMRSNVLLLGQVVLKRQAATALGADKYSLLTAAAAASDTGNSSSGSSGGVSGGEAGFSGVANGGDNTPGAISSSSASAATATTGSSSAGALSADEYRSLFARLPVLYRAPCFSLQQVKRCVAALQLHKWAREGDLDTWLSHRLTVDVKRDRASTSTGIGGGTRGDGRRRRPSQNGSRHRTRSRQSSSSALGAAVVSDTSGSSSPLPTAATSGGTSFADVVSQTDYTHPVEDDDEALFDGILESLGPLHRALHVCSVLGCLPQLHERLAVGRGGALDALLAANADRMRTLSLTDPGALASFISELTGFFVLETMISASVRSSPPAGDPFAFQGESTAAGGDGGSNDDRDGGAGTTNGLATSSSSSSSVPGHFAREAMETFCGLGTARSSEAAAESDPSLAFFKSGNTGSSSGGNNQSWPIAVSVATDPIFEGGAFSVGAVRRLWEKAELALDLLVVKQAPSLRTPEQLLVVKDEISLMTETFADPAVCLPCWGVVETTRLLWTHFEDLQLLSAKEAAINLLFDATAFQSLSLESIDEYRAQVSGLDLHMVPAAHVAADRRARERVVREGGAHMGRGSLVLAAAQSVSVAAAREIVNGGPWIFSATGLLNSVQASGVAGGGNSEGAGGNGADGASGEGGTSGSGSRKKTKDLLFNLDALEEETMGGGGVAAAATEGTDSTPDTSSPASNQSRPHAHSRFSSFGSELSQGLGMDNSGRGSGKDASFPSSMPFSALVPGVQRALYALVMRMVGFAAKNPPAGDTCEAACALLLKAQECIAMAMTDEVSRTGNEIPMNKACQISVDASSLAIASHNVWALLCRSLHTLNWYREGNTVVAATMAAAERKGRMLFMKVSMLAQTTLFEVLKQKTLELLESMLFIEYLPTTLPRKAHESITDLVTFLEAKMDTLSALPRSSRDIAHFTACNALSEGLLAHLLSPQVKQMNLFTLATIDLDCRRLTQYALAADVPSLNQCFSATHETVQAAIHPDLLKLSADDKLRRRLFPKVNPAHLAALLGKLVPLPSGASAASLPKLDKATIQKACNNLKKAAEVASQQPM